MIAVILAAGAESKPQYHGFTDIKPKCLYHVNGKTILERMISSLREASIKQIRVVIGFEAEQIEEYNRKNNLDLELVHNRKYATDAINSLLVGLEGIDDDVLILLGDIIVDRKVITQYIKHKSSLVWAKWEGAYRGSKYKAMRGTQWCIIKVAEEKLKIFRKARFYSEQFLKKRGGDARGEGDSPRLYGALFETLYQNGPIGEIILKDKIQDIDFLKQTDGY